MNNKRLLAIVDEGTRQLVADAACQPPDRAVIDAVIDTVEQEWRKDPLFDDFVRQMVHDEIYNLVSERVHRANVARKKAAGEYGRPAKVRQGSPVVNQVAHEVFLKTQTIGHVSLRRNDVPPLIDQLRTATKESGLNVKALGKATKVPPSAITDFVSGRDMQLGRALVLARHLGLAWHDARFWP